MEGWHDFWPTACDGIPYNHGIWVTMGHHFGTFTSMAFRWMLRLASAQSKERAGIHFGCLVQRVRLSWCGTYFPIIPPFYTIHTRSHGHGGAFKQKRNRSTTALAEIELYYKCWETVRHPIGRSSFWPLAAIETFGLISSGTNGEESECMLRSTGFYDNIFLARLLLAWEIIELTVVGM